MRGDACLIVVVTLLPCSGCPRQRPRGTGQTHVGDRPEWRAAPGRSPAGPSDESGTRSPARTLTFDLGSGVRMEFVLVPAGKFLMGSKLSAAEVARMFNGKEERFTDEHPRHEVTISRSFYLGIHEVTQAQWRTVMGSEPWKGKISGRPGDSNAASWMNWHEANEFCEKLSRKTGKKAALPTEAQWEYACRAGTRTVYCFGDDTSRLGDYAWYHDNSRKTGGAYAHPVGQKKPNAWGLYDMHGNVWEWCRDWYAKDFYVKGRKVDPENATESRHRTVRGGSWHNGPLLCRSAGRNSWCGANYRHYNYGFRVMVESGSKNIR